MTANNDRQTIEELKRLVQFYLENKITPIPCFPQTKQPCIYTWEEFQKYKPTKDELIEWFRTVWNPETWRTNSYWKAKWVKARRKALEAAGLTPEEIVSDPKLLEYDGSLSVAVLGGKTSNNLVYFDDDEEVLTSEELELEKQKTIVVKTQDGHHVWKQTFKPQKTKKGKKGELRGEGAYVMAPPSVHPRGHKYVIVSTAQQIKKFDSEEDEKLFLEWASEKLEFTFDSEPQSAPKPLNIEVEGCYKWHKEFLKNHFISDHLNDLSLTLFAPSMAQANVPKEKGAAIIYEWAKRCHEEMDAPLTVDPQKLERMIESAKNKGFKPLSQEGLKKKYPELYDELLEKGIIRLSAQSKAENLLELIKKKNPLYFQDQYRTPYIYIEDQKIHKTFKISGRDFKRFLTYLFHSETEENIKTDQIKDVILTLEAFSGYGPQIELHNRITWQSAEGTFEVWIDLCDDKWRSIKVTKDGWQIMERTPPMFRRYNHMQPFVTPDDTYDTYGCKSKSYPPTPVVQSPINSDSVEQANGGKEDGGGGVNLAGISSVSSVSSKPLDSFFKFVNIAEKDRLLTKILMVFYFIPHVPHVGNCVYGPKGAAKSTFHKMLKQLIDPSAVQVLDLPRDKNELLQVLFHHYVVLFDNINYIPDWTSDLFCRVITGAGAQKRQLYTDDEDIVYRLLRVLGFNGINIAAVKEDLLDRLVLLQLNAISSDIRKSERELYEDFNRVKPRLVSEILETLSKAIAKYPGVSPDRLFRMADFTKWGCAISEALGYTQKEFLDSYENKINDQIKEAVFNDLLGNVFLDFMENRSEWTGKATDLFRALKDHAKTLDVSTRVKDFPKASNILIRRLNLLLDSLSKLGITIEYLADGRRTIMIINSKASSKTELDKLEAIRTWIIENKKDGLIAVGHLKTEIANLDLNPDLIIEKLTDEGLLFKSNVVGHWGVSK